MDQTNQIKEMTSVWDWGEMGGDVEEEWDADRNGAIRWY